MALKLVIGNKNYSSWSMRPWLALRANNIPFDEVFIPLYTGEADKKRILSFTDSGKVPALIDADVTVWDSLAIIEYVAERFPQTRLWPEDPARRAHARSISAEMHRRLLRRRRHVCPRGASLSDLCDHSSSGGSRLHGHDDVVAGLSGVDARGACRDPRDREVRDGVGLNCQGFGATTPHRRRIGRSGPQAGAYRLGLGKNEFRQRLGDSSRTGKVTFIALKNLRNPRICHVPM